MTGCQNPATADETVNYNDALTVSVSPDPIQADNQTGGKTYRVVRGNNQPDELLAYDWHALFTSSLVLTQTATDEKLNLDFPVRVTGATLAIKQATGGIVTPPTGTDTEKYEYVPLSATGNQFTAVGSPLSLTVEMWYRPSEPSEGVCRDADLCVRGHRRHELFTLRRFQRGAVAGALQCLDYRLEQRVVAPVPRRAPPAGLSPSLSLMFSTALRFDQSFRS